MISFSVSLAVFRAAWQKVAAIVDCDSVSPIRTCVKFSLDSTHLLLGGLNLSQSIVIQVPVLHSSGSLSLAVPAAKLTKLLAVLTEDVLSFRAESGQLQIASGEGRWLLALEDVSAFPPLLGVSVPSMGEVESVAFRAALSVVLPVARKIGGNRQPSVTLDPSGGSVVAFDGHRKAGMGFAPITLPREPVVPLVIPVDGIARITSFMGGLAGTAELGANAHHFRVAFENWIFSTTLLAEAPMTWTEFPLDSPHFIGSFATREFLKSLDQAAVFSDKKDERGFSPKIHFDFAPGRLTLFSPDSATNSKIPIPITHAGRSFRIIHRLDSLRELVSQIPEFTLTIPGNLAYPSLIHSGPFRALISPMGG